MSPKKQITPLGANHTFINPVYLPSPFYTTTGYVKMLMLNMSKKMIALAWLIGFIGVKIYNVHKIGG